MILFYKVSDKILYSKELGTVLKITENIYVATPYSPENQGDIVKISETISKLVESSMQEAVGIFEALSVETRKPLEDFLSIQESIKVSALTYKGDAVTITENVVLLITSENGIINGSTINGAII